MSIKVVLSFWLVAIASGLSQGKEWRGIVPLHSTRTDVERLLGTPAENHELMSVYKLEQEVVVVQYAAGPPCGNDGFHIWQVPRGTVVGLTLSPKSDLRFSDLHIDASRYEITDGGHMPNYVYYTDKEQGIQYEVTQGLVMRILYFAAAKDNRLRCASTGGKQSCVSS